MKTNTYKIHLISSYIAHTHAHPNYHQSQASEPFLPWVQGSVFGSVSIQVGGLLILTTGLAHHTLMQHAPPLRTPYVPSFDTSDVFYIPESDLMCKELHIKDCCCLHCVLRLWKGVRGMFLTMWFHTDRKMTQKSVLKDSTFHVGSFKEFLVFVCVGFPCSLDFFQSSRSQKKHEKFK